MNGILCQISYLPLTSLLAELILAFLKSESSLYGLYPGFLSTLSVEPAPLFNICVIVILGSSDILFNDQW